MERKREKKSMSLSTMFTQNNCNKRKILFSSFLDAVLNWETVFFIEREKLNNRKRVENVFIEYFYGYNIKLLRKYKQKTSRRATKLKLFLLIEPNKGHFPDCLVNYAHLADSSRQKPLGPQMVNRLSFVFTVIPRTEGCDISQEDVCAHKSLARLCEVSPISVRCSHRQPYVTRLLKSKSENR